MVAARQPRRQPQRIVVDPDVLVGKPVVRGTRIPVELVLKHLAENPDVDELLAAYPRLTIDDVRACLAYAQSLVSGEDDEIVPASTARRRRQA
ncbi:MAG TPA: DUF433 domain-containing protein [Dehalococcoidia bacterium]|nr:DUF433 domain-containing protein [Dehalococcoidia bacterium]